MTAVFWLRIEDRVMTSINYCTIFGPPLAYICCGSSAKVAIVNLAEARHIGDIPCGEGSDPYTIAISPADTMAYVADYTRNMVLKLDLSRNQLVLETAVIGRPRGLDVSPCGQFIYVVFDDQPIMQILNSRLESVGQISLPSSSGSVTVTDNGSRAYVTQPDLNQTAVVDLCTNSVVQLLDTGTNPGRMAYSAKDGLLLVAGRQSQTLTPIGTCHACIGQNIPLSGTPAGLAFASGNRQCLVAMQQENEVAVVDLCFQQVITRIPVGQLPGGVAASRFYPLAIVSNQLSSTVTLINTQNWSVITTLVVGDDPVGISVIG